MTAILRKHWRAFSLTWSYAYLGIAMTLYEDLAGSYPPHAVVVLLLLAATIAMMIPVLGLLRKLPYGTVLLLWMGPTMALWIAFVFARAFLFGILGREL